MSNVNTSAAKNAPLPIIGEDVEKKLLDAYHTIYALMASYGTPLTVPVESTGKAEWERVAVRGMNALSARQAHIREQEVAAFRQGVRDAISPHIDTARAEKEEYDSLSPTLRAKLGAFPTFITVPLSDVSDAFGEGATDQDMVKKLVAMSYKVSKGANGAYSLRVDLPKSMFGDNAGK